MRPWPIWPAHSIADEASTNGGAERRGDPRERPAPGAALPARAAAMVHSVLSAVRWKAEPADDSGVLLRALELAFRSRVGALVDDHHPAYLHPGRVALILVRDEDRAEPALLAAASLVESRDPLLRVPGPRIEAELGPAIAGMVARVPSYGSDRLAERLSALEPDAVLVALAERLDHLRHEHLRSAVTPWPELVHETRHVWLPMAEREAPTLARRYRHWLRTFQRRL